MLFLGFSLAQMLISPMSLAAAPLCAQIFIQSEITSEQITSTIQELAQLRLRLDIAKTHGLDLLGSDLDSKAKDIFEQLATNPQVDLTVDQLKLQIKNEIQRLQDSANNSKQHEITVRAEQAEIIRRPLPPLPLATPEQLRAQEEHAKTIFSRYDAKAIRIPFYKRVITKKWKPDGVFTTPLETRDLILKDLSEQTKKGWTRIELLDEKARVVGEALWPINGPDDFTPYLTAFQGALGEAWSTNNFFNIKRVNIVSITDMTENISKDEINAAVQIKRWLEVMEFTDVSVRTAAIFKFTGATNLHKTQADMSAKISAMNGDYYTDWNDFHQGNTTFGEFLGPKAYSQHIHQGNLMWVRTRTDTKIYEQLLEQYQEMLEQ